MYRMSYGIFKTFAVQEIIKKPVAAVRQLMADYLSTTIKPFRLREVSLRPVNSVLL
jgi:hypothetical protein